MIKRERENLDLILFGFDPRRIIWKSLGRLRLQLCESKSYLWNTCNNERKILIPVLFLTYSCSYFPYSFLPVYSYSFSSFCNSPSNTCLINETVTTDSLCPSHLVYTLPTFTEMEGKEEKNERNEREKDFLSKRERGREWKVRKRECEGQK